jgi:Tfp pilus assembly PilM family ATPase
MRQTPKQSRTAIGLDIDARRINANQLESTSASAWRVTAATSIGRAAFGEPVTAEEALRVADTLDRLGFAGSRVVMAAPADKLITGMLELPKAGGGQIPLEQIARVELARTNKVTPDSFEMGCWELPLAARAGKTVQVMAMGYPHADAAQFLDVFESAGLDVTALDVRSCATARACAGMVAPAPAITALLDLGWSSASLVLLYSDMVVYARGLSELTISRVSSGLAKQFGLEADVVDYVLGELGLLSADAVDQTATDAGGSTGAATLALPAEARNLLTGFAEGVVRELLIAFSYVARQYVDASVTRMLLTGAGAPIPGLAEYFGNVLGLDTSIVAPKDLAECPPSLLDACASPELTPALGLALFPET